MYDEVERIAVTGDVAKLERALGDMKDKFASTTYAQQAGLLAAKAYVDAGKLDAAKGALLWVAEKSSDEGYQAVARLRLASVLIETKAYDEALKQLAGNFPVDFVPLAADRRGDVYLAQGKKTEAVAEYLKAYKGLGEGSEYRRLVDVKLAALGTSVQADRAVGSTK
jgi:predicted negative regulator of RcsB-dependent stress response